MVFIVMLLIGLIGFYYNIYIMVSEEKERLLEKMAKEDLHRFLYKHNNKKLIDSLAD